jgi:hypothetical protein
MEPQKNQNITYVLTNMHPAPLEGNFKDESGRTIKPRLIEDYNANMGFVDNSDKIANSYGIAQRTRKWTKKLFFHLTGMTIPNVIFDPQVLLWEHDIQKIPGGSCARFGNTEP